MERYFLKSIKESLRGAPWIGYAIDIYNHIRHPLRELALWRDFYKFKKMFRLFIEHEYPAQSDKYAVVLSSNDTLYQNKQEIMLAIALRLEGLHIKVLSSKMFPWASRYFKAVGICDIEYIEDLKLSSTQNREISHDLDIFLKKELDLNKIKTWRYRNVGIGSQIIATLCRYLQISHPDFTDSKVNSTFQNFTGIALKKVIQAENYFSGMNPEVIFSIETNYIVKGAFVDVAVEKGLNVIQVSQPDRDDSLYFKRLTTATRRLHPVSLAAEVMERIVSLPWTQEHEEGLFEEVKKRYSGEWFFQNRNQGNCVEKNKQQIIEQFDLDPNKKIAVIFPHLLWDANLFYGVDLFDDYGEWFLESVKTAAMNDKVNWLVKLHPANIWKFSSNRSKFSEEELIEKHIGKLPKHIKIVYPDTDVDVYSLYHAIDYGVTVRGTVGIELTCLGVLTLTAGTGRYSGLGFTEDSETRDAYLNKLLTIHEMSPMTKDRILLAKKYAYYLFRRRPWLMKSFKLAHKEKMDSSDPLMFNLEPTVKSVEELNNRGDLIAWYKWSIDRTQIDYLN